jgi:hypothetical protein
VKATGPMHQWEFRSRFRRHAFGWRSQPAIQRIRQAVTEIKRAARRDPVLGAEGAVLLLERISPALENVDSSSGAIGTAVNKALDALLPLIAEVVADVELREGGSTGCGPRSRPTRSRTSTHCPTTGVICAVPRSSPPSGPTG